MTTPRDVLDRQETVELIRRIMRILRGDDNRSRKRLLKYADIVDEPYKTIALLQVPTVGLWLLYTSMNGYSNTTFISAEVKKQSRVSLNPNIAVTNGEDFIAKFDFDSYANIKSLDDVTNVSEATEICVEFLKKWAALVTSIENEIIDEETQKREKEAQKAAADRRRLVERIAGKQAAIAAETLE